MKKKYYQPSMEVYKVVNEDIIATSYGDVKGGGTGTPGAKGYYGDYDDEDF